MVGNLLLGVISSSLFLAGCVFIWIAIKYFFFPIFKNGNSVHEAQAKNIMENRAKKLSPSATGSAVTTDGLCYFEGDNGKFQLLSQKRLHNEGWE